MTPSTPRDFSADREDGEDRPGWLEVRQGDSPLLVSLPHTGTDLPPELEPRLVSPWLARKAADWWIDRLYAFAADLGATTVRTSLSRTAIDVNRDPSGVSLYPGQATTELCPTTTFDGEFLYRPGREPTPDDVATRRAHWFDPYHATLDAEVARVKARHGRVVVYDCHSIRSVIPRLFEGSLPVFNIGTNGGTSCAPELQDSIEGICRTTRRRTVVNGRFREGYITRRLGRPAEGVHAIQMEHACRGYMREPEGDIGEGDWPTPYDPAYAATMSADLDRVLMASLAFAATAG